MEDLDALIRGAAIGIMLVMAAGFLRAWQRRSPGWIGALYTAGAIGYLLWGHPARSHWPPIAQLAVGVLALSTPFFFWALARLIFEDGFRLRPVHWALLGVMAIAAIGQAVLPGIRFPWLPGSLGVVFRLLSLGLIAHVFWLVWSGRSADLVERRARFRLVFFVGTAIAAALVVLAALVYSPAPHRPMPAQLAEAVAFLTLSLGLAIALLQLDRDFLPQVTAPALPSTEKPTVVPAADAAADRDAELLARLNALMRDRGGVAGDRTDHRGAGRPRRHPGISLAPPDQPPARLSQFHRLSQRVPAVRGGGAAR